MNPNSLPKMIRLSIPFTLCLVVPAAAQEVRVKTAMQEAPHYVGESVTLQFSVEGFDEQPQPTCTVEGEPPAGLRGRMAGANPSVYSQIVQQNGRLYQHKSITYRINYLVTAERAGEFTIGPFVIKQGKKEARVQSVKITFQEVPVDPNMKVRLVLPDKPVYPDQRVPVAIEWWYAGEMDKVLKLSIYSPLFDQFPFGPDEQPTRNSSRIPIETKSGQLALAAEVREEQADGRRYLVATAKRTLIPDRAAQTQLAPITATVRRATQWERSRSPFDDDTGFGGSIFRDFMQSRRRPAQVELVRAVGEPLTLTVKPFPREGKPESFAGAVGAGFSLEAAADRTVVRVGDPISLTLTLRGEGNIENAGLPPLSADGGMNPDQFRLPRGNISGEMTDGAKQFHVSVRVTDQAVGEIPAVAYSWFDPHTEAYQTTRSKPIALRVMEAKMVSAADVVSNAPNTTAIPNNSSSINEHAAAGETELAAAPAFTLSGADLAIEPHAGVVLRDSKGFFGSTMFQGAVYVIGMLFIVIALVDRRRRDVDPVLTERRKNLQRQRTRITDAAQLPKQKAAEQIADALRTLLAQQTAQQTTQQADAARRQVQGVIAECESVAYAPTASGEGRLDPSFIERAKAAAEMIPEK